MDQTHLNHDDTINYGSYYTPEWLVDEVYALLQRNIPGYGDYYILDTSCGYGGFLRGEKAIGADIDATAIKVAKSRLPENAYFRQNSLRDISRLQYGLNDHDKVIVVGNPPYNDTTSMIRSGIKKIKFERDKDVVARDTGISFLLSFNKIRADYICVLHPLSYLIKKKNFESLGEFAKNYKLTDSLIVSSGVFSNTSKATQFPIIIGLYERCLSGMGYDYIRSYKFKTSKSEKFSLKDYDVIDKYITKYPNHNNVSKAETIANFYTMRDINALKRMKTFIDKESGYTIRVTKDNFFYYCYVDIFKEYIPRIPYYFGNSNIMIDTDACRELKNVFIWASIKKHPYLGKKVETRKKYNDANITIENYFRNLLGGHYVE
jgi:methylase of polypeptide subunit release factors